MNYPISLKFGNNSSMKNESNDSFGILPRNEKYNNFYHFHSLEKDKVMMPLR